LDAPLTTNIPINGSNTSFTQTTDTITLGLSFEELKPANIAMHWIIHHFKMKRKRKYITVHHNTLLRLTELKAFISRLNSNATSLLKNIFKSNVEYL
jgi:hypothetical protein